MGYDFSQPDPSLPSDRRNDVDAGDIRGENLRSLRPIDQSLLRCVREVVAQSPSFETFETIVTHLGMPEGDLDLRRFWNSFAAPAFLRADSVRGVVAQSRRGSELPGDLDMARLSQGIDSLITVSRERDSDRLGYSLSIQPRAEALKGVSFSFHFVYGDPHDAAKHQAVSKLVVRPSRCQDDDSRANAVRSALSFFGISFDDQISKGALSSIGSPDPEFGIRCLELFCGHGLAQAQSVVSGARQPAASSADVDYLLVQDLDRSDFEFMIEKVGRLAPEGVAPAGESTPSNSIFAEEEAAFQKRQRDTWTRLWSKWLNGCPHEDESAVFPDFDVRRLARDAGLLIALSREFDGDRVRYSLDTQLDSKPHKGIRFRIFSPERSIYTLSESSDGAVAEPPAEGVVMLLSTVQNLADHERRGLMSFLLRSISSQVSSSMLHDMGDGVVNLGRSHELNAKNVKIVLRRSS